MPMPPAPTIPTTDAERRTLDSEAVEAVGDPQRYDLGSTPKTISAIGWAPVARMPSTGTGSMVLDSLGEELDGMPVGAPSAPARRAKGPKPTATTKSSAKTIVDGAAGVEHTAHGLMHPPRREGCWRPARTSTGRQPARCPRAVQRDDQFRHRSAATRQNLAGRSARMLDQRCHSVADEVERAHVAPVQLPPATGPTSKRQQPRLTSEAGGRAGIALDGGRLASTVLLALAGPARFAGVQLMASFFLALVGSEVHIPLDLGRSRAISIWRTGIQLRIGGRAEGRCSRCSAGWYCSRSVLP